MLIVQENVVESECLLLFGVCEVVDIFNIIVIFYMVDEVDGFMFSKCRCCVIDDECIVLCIFFLLFFLQKCLFFGCNKREREKLSDMFKGYICFGFLMMLSY